MIKKVNTFKKGFTLIEVVVSTGIFIVVGLVAAQVYFLIITHMRVYREQTTVSSLADEYMEVVRNLPYSQVGTVNGNPNGSLADMPNPLVINFNGTGYEVYYVVNYLDDPADGTIVNGTDLAPNDYKQVKLYIKNTATNTLNSFLSTIVPKGLEGLNSGGALSIKVFDAVGQPVSGAVINIRNDLISPHINLTRVSDVGGNWIEVGLPDSSNSYHVTVTKNNYSSDQTYTASPQNQNPVKPDATILNGQVTQVSFSIDLLSNLVFNITDQVCSPMSSVGLAVKGAKLIGTPDVLKFNNTYTSNSSGQVSLNNIEWDSYTPTLGGASYMIYGSSPIGQISILPNTSQNFRLVIGPKTANSLLVIVKDASTLNPIEGASVDLYKASSGNHDIKFTSGSVLSQQDWSLGSGQDNFIDPGKYYQDDGGIDSNGIPSGLRLASFNNAYVNAGALISSSFDTGTDSTAYTILDWQPTSQNPATNIKFQLAANNDNETWNFSGPDGTANSYYTVSGTTISPLLNNKRYIRYKVFLSTTDASKTPVLTSIHINYVSGCFAPGQAMFAGLSQGADYQVVINNSGYLTQTINNLSISGYNVLQVLLSH